MTNRASLLPFGAEVLPQKGGVHFRIWAPAQTQLSVVVGKDEELTDALVQPMESERDGYFSVTVPTAVSGNYYKFKIEENLYPDPAARFQPSGPHGASQIIDPHLFSWTDSDWNNVPASQQVIYEMHIGTFTAEGTWRAAEEELPALAELGVTVLEIMPVADFPGRYGWGYDGVCLYAPCRAYGIPDDFRSFINRAHSLGLAVILDVVYNHLGPDGNYLRLYSPDYFSSRYSNEWGEALNFDGKNSGPVREFFIENAGYWIREFHLDGLRLDATQQIFDDAPAERHIITLIGEKAREAAGEKPILLVAENEPQLSVLVRAQKLGGFGLDALWNDDFHHSAIVSLTGRNEAYYTDYKGSPQEFISAAKYGYLYQGQYYSWQKNSRGQPALDLNPRNFINFIQNHDQIANSLRGERIQSIGSPTAVRALTALLLLGPGLPMLFQGQEFAAATPFLYFADHNPELAKLVAKGREEFLRQFPSFDQPEVKAILQNPECIDTFMKCKLNFQERAQHQPWYDFHRDLLALRREDATEFPDRNNALDGAVLDHQAFVLRFFSPNGKDRLLLINLGRHLDLLVNPEPLMAPPPDHFWEQVWCSENLKYGGSGMPSLKPKGPWILPGPLAVWLAAKPSSAEQD